MTLLSYHLHHEHTQSVYKVFELLALTDYNRLFSAPQIQYVC